MATVHLVYPIEKYYVLLSGNDVLFNSGLATKVVNDIERETLLAFDCVMDVTATDDSRVIRLDAAQSESPTVLMNFAVER